LIPGRKGRSTDAAAAPWPKATWRVRGWRMLPEIRYANVAKVMGDHREQIDDLLRRLVQRNLGGRQA
jgi:hypothetical protein